MEVERRRRPTSARGTTADGEGGHPHDRDHRRGQPPPTPGPSPEPGSVQRVLRPAEGRAEPPERRLQPVLLRRARPAPPDRPGERGSVPSIGGRSMVFADGDHDRGGVEVGRGGVHLLQHGGGQRRLRDDGPRDGRPDAGQVAELVDQRRGRLRADARRRRAARRWGRRGGRRSRRRRGRGCRTWPRPPPRRPARCRRCPRAV